MTDEKRAMTVEEAIEWANVVAVMAQCYRDLHFSRPLAKAREAEDVEALSVLSGLAEERDKFKDLYEKTERELDINHRAANIRESALEAENAALKVERDALKAEVDGYKVRVDLDAETIKLNFETIDKAKAEVERLNKRDEGALKCPECWEPIEQIHCPSCLLTFAYGDTEKADWKARAEKAEADLSALRSEAEKARRRIKKAVWKFLRRFIAQDDPMGRWQDRHSVDGERPPYIVPQDDFWQAFEEALALRSRIEAEKEK